MINDLENLLEETIHDLKANGKTQADVRWVGSLSGAHRVSPEKFWSIAAGTNYDSGYGGARIESNLVIVGDSWWLERHEYDGCEWWEYKELPTAKEDAKEFDTVLMEYSTSGL